MNEAYLYLLPAPISDDVNSISQEVREIVKSLDTFAVEHVKNTRRYLRALGLRHDFDQCTFFDIRHKNPERDLDEAYDGVIQALKKGKSVGVLSDAGLPGIADPAAEVVIRVHDHGFKVKPIAGPSSMLLALVASGLNGQSFTFHGYLPIDKSERDSMIKKLESQSIDSGYSQLLMETPYRNESLWNSLLQNLQSKTMLCRAYSISSSLEDIRTMRVSDWKKQNLEWVKAPCVFIIGASATR